MIDTRDTEPVERHPISRRHFLAGLAVLALGGCATEGPTSPKTSSSNPSISPTETYPDTEPEIGEGLSDPAKKLTAAKIISSFENSTLEIRYNYTENLDDGRGITAGRAGFTTRDGDLLYVVQQYTELAPDNPLAQYIPALENIYENTTDSTEGLDGFTTAWENISDPLFREVQDRVVDEVYFNPAMQYAKDAGINSALGQLIIFDTIIQHGEGEAEGEDQDIDGLPYIIDEVKTTAGQTAENETEWLRTFLEIRRKHLMNPADPDTREDWLESVGRIDGLLGILNTGNLGLKLPLEWDVYGDHFILTSQDAN